MKLTDKQAAAVSTRDRDIIISAAAGSGKTTVLAERVLSLIKEGADIRRMLICTYTRPAAAELRRRIYNSLSRAAGELKDARLRFQADCVQSALIGTIHSFCTQVINDNFLRAGLKLGWRTGGTALCDRLKRDAVNDALGELYEEENADMLWLSARYGGRADKALAEQLLALYELSRSLPEGIDGLKKDKEQFEELIQSAKMEYITGELALMRTLAKNCIDTAALYADFEKEYPSAEQIYDMTESLARAYEQNGEEALIQMISSFSLPRLKPRLKPEDAVAHYKSCKQGIKDCAAEIAEILEKREYSIAQEAEYMTCLGDALNTVLTRFQTCYEREKSERGILDYDDLIHTAYSLLKHGDIAEQYKNKLDHVFIDEYQDTNEIQDALLERICADDVRFIVGDVKQSIYSFRLADPSVFIKKIEKISETGRVIYMNDNFRSSPDVIDEINRIMGELMNKELGGVDYTGGEVLVAGRDNPGSVEILAAVDSEKPYDAEADMIAKKVEQLLNEGYKYGDIAILLRKKSRADIIKKALEIRGIPVFFDGAVGSPPEIDLFVEHLKLLDSENDDRSLIAVMRSPAVGFNEEEMARIRCNLPEGSFADAVRGYDKDDKLGEKIAGFLSQIGRLRLLAHAMPTESFLIELKKFTRFDEILPALSAGEMRYDSFTRFFDSLLGYAGEGGLYSLICTLEQIKEKNGGSYAQAEDTAVPDNCVNIMTIHKSKGLQFKAVIVSQLADQFNMQDTRAVMMGDRRWGAVSDIFDAQHLRKFPSLSRTLLCDERARAAVSEQLRVLYVALTRAEERLIMTCGVKREDAFSYIPPIKGRSFMSWLYLLYGDNIKFVYPERQDIKEEQRAALEDVISAAKAQTPVNVLHPHFNDIPVKLGVSSLLSAYESDGSTQRPEQPMLDEAPAEGRRVNCGTDFGTLVHAFLQHYDYKNRPSIAETIETLKERRLLDDADAAQILEFEGALARFIHSPMADRIAAADELLRELPFSIGISARELGYDSDDTVVIQGIIDLVLREGGEYTIIDYKTNLSRDYDKLREHYAPQLGFYRRALEQSRGVTAKNCLLCFIRSGKVLGV